MKKIVLSVVLNIITLASFSQTAYYDAVELSKFIRKDAPAPVFMADSASLTKVSEILLKYCQGIAPPTDYHNVISAIVTNDPANPDYNPVLAPFLDINLPQGGMDILMNSLNGSQKSVFTAAGNLNVTNFADGLAKFLVERSKEELNVAFFRKFQDYMRAYPEVKIIFPTTSSFLNDIYSYQYNAMLPALRAAFLKDFNSAGTNFLNLRKSSAYDGYTTDPEIRKRADAIIAFLKTPDGRSALAAVMVMNGIVKGRNAAEIISRIADDEICTAFPDDNLSNVLRFVDLLSRSLRSHDEGRVWITKQQVNDLVNDDISMRIYLGLVYAADQKNKPSVCFNLNGRQTCLKEVLAEINKKWSSSGNLIFKKSFASTARAMSDVSENAKIMSSTRTQDDQDFLIVYADYAAGLSGFLKQAVTLLSDNPGILPGLSGLAPDVLKFTVVLDETTNASYDLQSQNYCALVMHTSSLLSDLLGPRYTYKNDFIKYGTFMANIADAKSSDEVHAAIDAAVMPVGSSSVKRETDFNVSVNAYIGPFAGEEYLPKLKQNPWAFSAGVTAPVGIAFSWGNLGKGIKRSSGKVSGGKSLSVFIPLIDVGALASFRMGNDSSNIASEVKLANIVSPGLFLYYGFGKCPVSIGLGAQLGPQLREVTATDINTDQNYYLRFGFNIVVDIPFFNLYTKN